MRKIVNREKKIYKYLYVAQFMGLVVAFLGYWNPKILNLKIMKLDFKKTWKLNWEIFVKNRSS